MVFLKSLSEQYNVKYRPYQDTGTAICYVNDENQVKLISYYVVWYL